MRYDTSALEVRVRSTFFDTFANQYAADRVADPRAVSAIVDGVEHRQPLVVKALPGRGLAVAAVRRVAGAVSEGPIFTLEVSLKPGASAGDYSIGMAPTIVRNTAAGYAASGEELDVLVGRNAATGTFPVLLPASDAAVGITEGGM